jgi:chitinase
MRACAINCGKNWDKHLSLAGFAYNNSVGDLFSNAMN